MLVEVAESLVKGGETGFGIMYEFEQNIWALTLAGFCKLCEDWIKLFSHSDAYRS